MELLLFPTILLALTHGLTTAKTLAPNPDKITNGTRRIVLEGDEEVSFIAVGDCTVGDDVQASQMAISGQKPS